MAPIALKLLAASALAATAPSGAAALSAARDVREASTPDTSEGEDLLAELTDIVLNNKQQVLPIPFEMILERDVGSVIEYPIKENSTAYCKTESLKTVREVSKGLPPVIPITAVYIKDTDQPAQPAALYRTGGSIGGHELAHLNGVVNPTSEVTVIGWQRIKYAATKAWLESWKVRGPNKIVVIHSAGDVLYGGCDENTLMFKYNQIVAANGGSKIVLGAEVSPYPSDSGWAYAKAPAEIATQMSSALSSLGLATTWASAYANCTGGLNSICDATPTAKYANGGFIMGPVSDIMQMLSSLDQYNGIENRLISEYFLENSDKVGLDYSGTVFMSLHNMVKNGNVPVEVVGKTLKSKVTNSKVCFVQGNGNSFGALKVLATALKA